MADTIANETKISIKVIIDKVNKRVLYAEADHTFVDILFSFVTLPMGTIIRLLEKHEDKNFKVFGSLNTLYQSLKDLPDSYLSTVECKYLLLNPRSASYDHCRNLKLKLDDTEPMKYFFCAKGCHTSCFSILSNAKCRQCGSLMNKPYALNSDVRVGGGVFVSDLPTFIVTDDFSVMPYTAAASIRLLTDLGITDMNHLEERKLDMGQEQMLLLLKMALSIDYPLTQFALERRRLVTTELGNPSQGVGFDPCDVLKKEASTSSKILIDVFLQKSTRKVLFAEAQEDFVDFLFGILSLPLGTVTGTLMNGASSWTV